MKRKGTLFCLLVVFFIMTGCGGQKPAAETPSTAQTAAEAPGRAQTAAEFSGTAQTTDGQDGASSQTVSAPNEEPTQTAISQSEETRKAWTKEKLRSLFADKTKDHDWEIVDCAIISDLASGRVGAILFLDHEKQTVNAAFLDEEGLYQMCGILAPLYSEHGFTYLGNGTVSFRLQTEEGDAYGCRITFSSENGNVNFVVEDDL